MNFKGELAGKEKLFNLLKAKQNKTESEAVTPVHFKLSITA